MLHPSLRKFVLLATIHSSVAEWSARGTRKLVVPDSRPALPTRWICSRSSRVQNLAHTCVPGLHYDVTKIQTKKLSTSSEFLLSWGITTFKHLNSIKFSVRNGSLFSDRGRFNFQSFAWRGILIWRPGKLLWGFITTLPIFWDFAIWTFLVSE